MKRNAVPLLVLAALCAGYVLFIAATLGQLPERVAMHFGGAGRADNWMDRAAAVTFFLVMGLGIAGLFVGLGAMLGWMPDWTFNLPNRAFWLAPERRAETVGFCARQLFWLGSVMILFFYGIYWLTILANRTTPARLPMELFLPLVVGFILFVVAWTFVFIRRFATPRG